MPRYGSFSLEGRAMSDIREFNAHSVAGVEADVRASELVMGFEYGAERRKVIVRLPAGAAGGLFLAIRDKLRKLTRPDAERVVVLQPLVVRSASPFSVSPDEVGLALGIENYEIPLLMPPETIADLRTSLDEVELLAKNPPRPPRKN